jgi:Fe-S-cluster containining protein
MENMYEENYIKKRPQSLCKNCGRCCRVATNTKYTYSEIQKLAEEGDEYALDFLKIFEPYPSVEAAREVDSATVDNILNALEQDGNMPEEVTFYRCRYILPNNLCSIYEERPKVCVYCPSSAWVVTPPGCGFEHWLFLKREEYMQKVRKAKEELLDLKVMRNKTKDENILKKIESVQKKIEHTIDMFADYGSQYW